MKYMSDYWENVDKVELPDVIDDKFVDNFIKHHEKKYSPLKMYGLCGKDVTQIDMSNLSYDKFLMLSFDSNTIFSKEQMEKFHPYKILKDCENYYKSMDVLHKAGITGRGVDVLIMDTPFDHTSKQFEYIDYNDEYEENKHLSHMHGISVTSIFQNIAPEANIYFNASHPAPNKHPDNFLVYRYNYLKQLLKKGDKLPDIVSISASLLKEEGKRGLEIENKTSDELTKELKQRGCELIDSPRFSKTFTHCNCYNGVYSLHDDYSITDEEYKREVIRIKSQLENIEEIKKELSEEEFENVVSTYNRCLQGKEEYEKIYKERVNDFTREKIGIVSGGITYTQNDCNSGKMYNSFSSQSWAIPQASALYAISKQLDRNISYDEFYEVCKKTAIENPYSNRVINPEGIVREINERNKTKAQIDPKYNEIYSNSSKLISNLDRMKEQEEPERIR